MDSEEVDYAAGVLRHFINFIFCILYFDKSSTLRHDAKLATIAVLEEEKLWTFWTPFSSLKSIKIQ